MGKRAIYRVWLLSLIMMSATLTNVGAQTEREPLTPENIGEASLLALLPEPGTGNILGIDWSPDGTVIALATDAGIQIYGIADSAAQLQFTVPPPRDDIPVGVAFSADGRLLASGQSLAGTISVWDADTGERVAVLAGGNAQADQIEFSADGLLLATYSLSADSVFIWGVDNGAGRETISADNAFQLTRLATLEGGGQFVAHIAFSPDSATLAIGGRDGGARLWDMTTFDEINRFDFDYPGAIAFTPDGAQIAVSEYPGGDMTLLQIDDGARFPMETPPFNDQPAGIGLSPDGRLLARVYRTFDGSPVHVWDTESGRLIAELEGTTWIAPEVAFSPDGTLLAALGYADGVRVYGIGEELPVITTPPELTIGAGAVVTLTFSQDVLNMRSDAGVNFDIVARLTDEATVTIIGGPQIADGYTWWNIRTAEGVEGWAVDEVERLRTLRPE
jgi:WD40 repeat protein